MEAGKNGRIIISIPTQENSFACVMVSKQIMSLVKAYHPHNRVITVFLTAY